MSDYNDYPPSLIAESMRKQIARGATCYMKWTCANCGERVTMSEPNKVFLRARHDEPQCGFVTDIETTGCNFLFVLSVGTNGGRPLN